TRYRGRVLQPIYGIIAYRIHPVRHGQRQLGARGHAHATFLGYPVDQAGKIGQLSFLSSAQGVEVATTAHVIQKSLKPHPVNLEGQLRRAAGIPHQILRPIGPLQHLQHHVLRPPGHLAGKVPLEYRTGPANIRLPAHRHGDRSHHRQGHYQQSRDQRPAPLPLWSAPPHKPTAISRRISPRPGMSSTSSTAIGKPPASGSASPGGQASTRSRPAWVRTMKWKALSIPSRWSSATRSAKGRTRMLSGSTISTP